MFLFFVVFNINSFWCNLLIHVISMIDQSNKVKTSDVKRLKNKKKIKEEEGKEQ